MLGIAPKAPHHQTHHLFFEAMILCSICRKLKLQGLISGSTVETLHAYIYIYGIHLTRGDFTPSKFFALPSQQQQCMTYKHVTTVLCSPSSSSWSLWPSAAICRRWNHRRRLKGNWVVLAKYEKIIYLCSLGVIVFGNLIYRWYSTIYPWCGLKSFDETSGLESNISWSMYIYIGKL